MANNTLRRAGSNTKVAIATTSAVAQGLVNLFSYSVEYGVENTKLMKAASEDAKLGLKSSLRADKASAQLEKSVTDFLSWEELKGEVEKEISK